MKSMARSSSQRLLIVFAMLSGGVFLSHRYSGASKPYSLSPIIRLVPTSAVPGGGQFTLTVTAPALFPAQL